MSVDQMLKNTKNPKNASGFELFGNGRKYQTIQLGYTVF